MNKKIIKNALIAVIGLVALLNPGCQGGAVQQENNAVVQLSREEIKAMPFSELFTAIEPKDISESVFTTIGEDFSVLTAGNPSHYNTMVASWGGWGILFNNPVVFSMLRSNRYTLELMRKEETYTMKFFDLEFRDDIIQFGMSSGRDNDEKMRNTQLTAVQTPAGNMVFKEARLIIECKLIQVTTVSPDDFLVEANRQFVVDAHAEANDYHKMVYGAITNVWIRKF